MSNSRPRLKEKLMRTFFLSSETGVKDKNKVKDIENEITNTGLSYIQMKLPISKITPDFEDKLTQQVERNILRAKIREATEDDLQSVMFIHNKAWMTSNSPYAPISLDSLKKIYSYPDTIIFIAKVYGSDAGFIMLDFEGPNKEYGVIAGLGVLPRFQRKGLGTVLGMTGWNYFKQKGVSELRCEVYVENKASYYFIKSLGFEEFETKCYKMEDFQLKEDSI